MKLYATTTSERATKGQGGNDELVIKVQDEHQKEVASFYILPREKDMLQGTVRIFVRYLPSQASMLLEEVRQSSHLHDQTKGKKQKGDNLFESPEKTIKRIQNDTDTRYDDVI